jgi:hypothetical protein
MNNKFPYQLIFHTSEEVFNSEEPSIEGSMSTDKVPSQKELSKLMLENNSTYCEIYYDKRDNEEYEELICTYQCRQGVDSTDDLMTKYVLYDSTDDTISIELTGSKAVLYDTLEDAKKEWTGYPEEPIMVNELPKHHKEIIIKENGK